MEIQAVDVLKWIGIVLAAGFVGYFGRYLAMLLIDKAHRRKGEIQESGVATVKEPEADYAIKLDENRRKLEKKKAKQMAKKAKKERG